MFRNLGHSPDDFYLVCDRRFFFFQGLPSVSVVVVVVVVVVLLL